MAVPDESRPGNAETGKAAPKRRNGRAGPHLESVTPVGLLYVLTIPHSALWYLKGQLQDMQRRGYRVTFVSSQGQHSELQEVSRREGVQTLPLEVSREINVWQDLRAMWDFNLIMRQVRPQIVNFGNPKTGLVGGLVSWLRRTPVRVYTLHGLRLETATGLRRRVLWLTEKITMLCAHRVVAVSQSLLERTLELGLTRRSKIMVLERGSVNGVPPMSADPEEVQALRRTLALPSGAVVFGFVGRFTRDKGIRELVEAFTRLRASQPLAVLLLVGDYEQGDPVDDRTRQHIREGEGIIWAGYASDVTAYYAVMDVLVLPTYREGFPTVALEGGAMGLPVITTLATGARDAVVDQITGRVVPVGDIAALHDAMNDLATDAALRLDYGRSAHALVTTDYAQETIWAAWDTLYQELLSKRRSKGEAVFWTPVVLLGTAAVLGLLTRYVAEQKRKADRSQKG